MKDLNIIVLDSNTRRRAEIAHKLTPLVRYVEPCESIGEALALDSETGVILVHDTGDILARLMREMENRRTWIAPIAYRADAPADRIVDAVRAGAIDYLTLPCEPAIWRQHILQSWPQASEETRRRRGRAQARGLISRLSEREREVLGWLAQGNSNKAIARELEISPRTVEIHRANMMGKLHARHTADAVRIALESQIA